MKLEISCCKGGCLNKTTVRIMESHGENFGIILDGGWSFELVETINESLVSFVCPDPKHVKL